MLTVPPIGIVILEAPTFPVRLLKNLALVKTLEVDAAPPKFTMVQVNPSAKLSGKRG